MLIRPLIAKYLGLQWKSKTYGGFMICLKCDPTTTYEVTTLLTNGDYWKLFARSKHACFTNGAHSNTTNADGTSYCLFGNEGFTTVFGTPEPEILTNKTNAA